MKKELKGFVCGFTTMAVLSAGVASASGFWDTINVLRNDISVVVNGENITADNFVYNDTTYLPLRAVSEALNQTVSYDENSNTAYIGVDSNNQTPNANNSQTAYYAEVPWCPDYGSIFNISKVYDKPTSSDNTIGHAYVYPLSSQEFLSKYYEVLENEGFERKYADDKIVLYSKGNLSIGVSVNIEHSLIFVMPDEKI